MANGRLIYCYHCCCTPAEAHQYLLGPVAGGFLGETHHWRWILGLAAIVGGVIWVPAILATHETYAPVILRRRAKAFTQKTGRVYMSRLDAGQPQKRLSQELRISLTRPWILLFREPIVLLTSLYVAIVYGTIYMCFPAFPIVFEATRGWSQGMSGHPFRKSAGRNISAVRDIC